MLFFACNGDEPDAPVIQGTYTVDHNKVAIDDIPLKWTDSVIVKLNLHYAHTSHGSQLTTGLSGIKAADPVYCIAIGSGYLPYGLTVGFAGWDGS